MIHFSCTNQKEESYLDFCLLLMELGIVENIPPVRVHAQMITAVGNGNRQL